MSTIMPESEGIRAAVKWISAGLQEENPKPLKQLLQEATLRFDLSPLESEFVSRFYQDSKTRGSDVLGAA